MNSRANLCTRAKTVNCKLPLKLWRLFKSLPVSDKATCTYKKQSKKPPAKDKVASLKLITPLDFLSKDYICRVSLFCRLYVLNDNENIMRDTHRTGRENIIELYTQINYGTKPNFSVPGRKLRIVISMLHERFRITVN